MLETISQFAIPVLGTFSILLIARKNKWGLVLGLCAQPFWFYTTYTHGQWGAFTLSVIYTLSWMYGIHVWFRGSSTNRAS